MSGLLESCYAAARVQLRKARQAQCEALYAGLGVYRGGRFGRDCRWLRDRMDRARAAHLAEALGIRARIRQLRIEIAAITSDETEPPRAA
jgi:hypothetical protein